MHKDITYACIQGREGDVPLEQISKNERQTTTLEHLKSSVAPNTSSLPPMSTEVNKTRTVGRFITTFINCMRLQCILFRLPNSTNISQALMFGFGTKKRSSVFRCVTDSCLLLSCVCSHNMYNAALVK